MKDRAYTHVAVGNFNLDVVVYVERLPEPGETLIALDANMRPGGAATNYAATVAQYGHRVHLVASVSSREYVKSALDELRELGVLVDYVKVVDEDPGVVVVLVQPGGERTMLKYPGANKELSVNDVPVELLEESHVVHMASVSPELAMGISKVCAKRGILVTYDPGVYVSTLKDVAHSLVENLDILFLNEREIATLSKQFKVSALFKYGLRVLVVKMGQRGAVAILPSGVCYHGSTTPIKKPVDATGAGDAFDALFNAKYIESQDPSIALAYGVAAGALKVGYRGSFMRLDHKLLKLQLERVVVSRTLECPHKLD